MRDKLRYLKMTGFVLLYMGIFFGGFKLFGYLIGLLYQTPIKDTLDYLLNEWKVWIIIFFITPVLIYLLIFKIRKTSFITFCRFRALSSKDLLLTCLLGITTFIFTSHLVNLSFMLKYIPEFAKYVDDAVVGNIISVMTLLAIVLPTCEEILFRGLIFNEMRKHLPLLAVLIIHSLFYMPFQPNPQVAVFAYINFTLYALVFIFTDSLWGSIIVECVGALGLFGLRLAGVFPVIRGWGDWYLGSVIVLSLGVIIILTLALKKHPFKVIFARQVEAETEVKAG